MTYTIISARYANSDHSAALVETVEAGWVAASVADTPELWEQAHAGRTPSAYQEPAPSIDDYRRAIQSHVDATAQSQNYDSGVTCSSYVNSTNPVWAAQATAFVAWRDAVWAHSFTELDKVQNGQKPQPTTAELLNQLPALTWPAALGGGDL